MLNYIYPNRKITDTNQLSQRNNIPILHTNVSTYAQALIQFNDSNPVPETSWHKRLNLQSNEKYISTKNNSTQEIAQTIHNKSENKTVT